ncbi:COX15/CtaA family protein [Natronomonas sp. EA1]|uniref:COX15/CtaA family protein n=1 Tax=Natronomonas sp. EA1 TaxID=3421655 RepID=UPI003EBBC0BD
MEFRKLAAGTAALTGVLMLLGVYTAAAGAGLTCGQRWPLCDGFLGLFPANWPSFIEWFHRFVAMITGFVILATTIQAWRTGQESRVKYASTLALVILPVQVVLGGLTVLQYEWAILIAHFATATSIFALLTLAAAWSWKGALDRTAARARTATLAAAGALPVAAVFTPRLFVTFGEAVQVVYYALALAAFGSLVAATVWLRAERTKLVTGLAAAIVAALLVLGRQNFDTTVAYAALAATLVAASLALLGSQWAKQEIGVTHTTSIFTDD